MVVQTDLTAEQLEVDVSTSDPAQALTAIQVEVDVYKQDPPIGLCSILLEIDIAIVPPYDFCMVNTV